MKKDEENKKKMFNFVKRLKENARRNPPRLTPVPKSNSNENTNRPIVSNSNIDQDNLTNHEELPITTSPSSQVAEESTKKKSKNTINETEANTTDTNDNNCSICLRENREPALCNECFHCFCFPCIQQWSEQSNQCPVCRREYNMILYNIRSETEYDELPVSPRRSRVNEFEIILPLGNFVEFDRAFERLINLPTLQPMQPLSPINNPFLPPISTIAGLNPQFNRPLEPENTENMITLSVTNFNSQPDQNGQRLVQRTFFFSEPTNLETNQTNQLTNTPSSSLERNNLNQPILGLFNPLLLQDPNLMQQQQPTVVFNPNYMEPYRNLERIRNFDSPSNTVNFRSTPINLPTNLENEINRSRLSDDRPIQTIDNIFDRIFNELTQQMFPANNQHQRSNSQNQRANGQHQRSNNFPTENNANSFSQLDQNNGNSNTQTETENDPRIPNVYRLSGYRGRRLRRRPRDRGGRNRRSNGRSRSNNSRNNSTNRRNKGSKN